jgi:hypothetical protein
LEGLGALEITRLGVAVGYGKEAWEVFAAIHLTILEDIDRKSGVAHCSVYLQDLVIPNSVE